MMPTCDDHRVTRTVGAAGRTSPGGSSLVGLATLVAVAAVLTLRVIRVFGGQVGGLVLAGSDFSDAGQLTIPVIPGGGYDGQFLFRQALDPFQFSLDQHHGIRLDLPLRYGRIGYPLVGWLLSGLGRPPLVPWALPAISVLALAGLGYLFALAAQRANRSAWWGLAAVAVPGLWFAAGRDLSEPLSAVLVVGGAWALHRRRWGWVISCWTVAVLVREQSVLLPVAFGVFRLFGLLHGRRFRFQRCDLGWIVPGAALAAWSVSLKLLTGSAPAAVSSQLNVVWPGQDLIPAVVDWSTPTGPAQILWLLELATFVALAGWVLGNRRATGWERTAAAGGLLLVSVLSHYVLQDPAHFRQLGELWAVYWLVVLRLADRRTLAAAAGVSATLTLGVVGLMVTG